MAILDINGLKEGNFYRRDGWSEGDCIYVQELPSEIVCSRKERHLVMQIVQLNPTTTRFPFSMSSDDILATDWSQCEYKGDSYYNEK